jgi:hypothetical protein
VAAERDALEETIEHLYGLPLDEFTQARDAAVKERRGAKDRDGAEAIRRLRKPNLVAWSLNRVRRNDPKAIDELIAAGERLGEAQRALVESGERGSLRSAAAEERAQVGRVVELAAAELSAAGHASDTAIETKLFATLHAAAANPDVRGELALGRLLRDHELSDLGLGGAGALAAPAPTAPKRSGTKGSAPKAKAAERDRARTDSDEAAERDRARAERDRERKIKALNARIARAKERRDGLAEKAKETRDQARAAERTARRAAKEFERAEAAAETAATAAEGALQMVADLEGELASLQ